MKLRAGYVSEYSVGITDSHSLVESGSHSNADSDSSPDLNLFMHATIKSDVW